MRQNKSVRPYRHFHLRYLLLLSGVAILLQGCEFLERIGIALRGLCDQRIYIVNRTDDDRRDGICTSTDCSLYDAFLTAYACGGDHEIRLATGEIYELTLPTIPVEGTTGRSSLYPINGTVILEGNGSTIQAQTGTDFRFIEILSTGDLTVHRTSFIGGHGDTGGAIQNAGKLTVEDSSFEQNRASVGGGIYNSGDLTVMRSLFAGNFALPGAGSGGGGIYSRQGMLRVRSSTFSHNRSVNGAAILLTENNRLGEIRDCTFADNVSREGSLMAFAGSGPIRIINSAFQRGEQGPNCSIDPGANVMVRHHNMSDDNSCERAMQVDSLMLGPLGSIEGPTRGYLPASTSPLVDAGPVSSSDTSTNACLTMDQRLQERPRGRACDIGAVELK